jgi:cytochrome c-type biogenesis protein
MEPLSLTFIFSAFIAGLLTFLAPCTLPLVPAYLGFISGVSVRDLNDKERSKFVKRKILWNGVAFIFGFTLVFIFFGTLAGFLGQTLTPFRIWLTRIGGALVLLFGLFMMGALSFKMLRIEKRMRVPSFITLGKPTSSFAIGSAFAFGWTPCVGPILGSILLFASTSGTALTGAFLLAVFSIGLAVPFLLITFGISSATQYINTYFRIIRDYSAWILGVLGLFVGLLLNLVAIVLLNFVGIPSLSNSILSVPYIAFLLPIATSIFLAQYALGREFADPVSLIAGLFLVPLGFLLMTDNFSLTIQYGYQFFDFINYEGLLDYL